MPLAKIAKERCATCIFGPNSPIAAARMRNLKKSWNDPGKPAHQVCHTHGRPATREDVWCRGFLETQTPVDVQDFMQALVECGAIEVVG